MGGRSLVEAVTGHVLNEPLDRTDVFGIAWVCGSVFVFTLYPPEGDSVLSFKLL